MAKMTSKEKKQWRYYRAIYNLKNAEEYLMAALGELNEFTNTIGNPQAVVDAQTQLGNLINEMKLGEHARFLEEETDWSDDPVKSLQERC